jgi:hypothetical protein
MAAARKMPHHNHLSFRHATSAAAQQPMATPMMFPRSSMVANGVVTIANGPRMSNLYGVRRGESNSHRGNKNMNADISKNRTVAVFIERIVKGIRDTITNGS